MQTERGRCSVFCCQVVDCVTPTSRELRLTNWASENKVRGASVSTSRENLQIPHKPPGERQKFQIIMERPAKFRWTALILTSVCVKQKYFCSGWKNSSGFYHDCPTLIWENRDKRHWMVGAGSRINGVTQACRDLKRPGVFQFRGLWKHETRAVMSGGIRSAAGSARCDPLCENL